MGRATRLCVLAVGLLSLLGAFTSSAGAITWHNSGMTTFTGSGTAGTVSVTGVTVTCATATTTGTLPALTVGNIYRASGFITFTGCSISGVPTTVDCSYTLTGTGQDGSGMGSVITGTNDVDCTTNQFGTNICRSTGTVSGSYTNTVPASATLFSSNTMRYHNGTGGTCPLGVGDPVGLTGRTATSTVANPPTITRTP